MRSEGSSKTDNYGPPRGIPCVRGLPSALLRPPDGSSCAPEPLAESPASADPLAGEGPSEPPAPAAAPAAARAPPSPRAPCRSRRVAGGSKRDEAAERPRFRQEIAGRARPRCSPPSPRSPSAGAYAQKARSAKPAGEAPRNSPPHPRPYGGLDHGHRIRASRVGSS